MIHSSVWISSTSPYYFLNHCELKRDDSYQNVETKRRRAMTHPLLCDTSFFVLIVIMSILRTQKLARCMYSTRILDGWRINEKQIEKVELVAFGK